ncbi:MAG: hypothetical protein DDT33_01590 [Firmicutes bacterium]|nr:hypothetical protein [Bacillota bacterium]
MKVKAHTRYKTKDGIIVPGTTTITGLLNKPALIKWSNDLGLRGISVGSYVDDKAMIGSLSHEMILAHLSKRDPDTADYSKNQIDQAENSFLSYLEWEKQHKIEPILTEHQEVSEIYRYGGTFDFYGLVDGMFEIIDFKTGKGIFPEFWIQISGYSGLLKEIGKEINGYRILNIPRTEDENFKEEYRGDVSLHFQAFLKLLDFYYINKQLMSK